MADQFDAVSSGGDLVGWVYRPGHAPGSSPAADGAPDVSGGSNGGGWLNDVDDGFGLVAAIGVVLLGVVAAFAVFWWALLPVLLVVLDFTLVILLLVLGTIARVLFRRPWTVSARSADGDLVHKRVVGWTKALRARDDLAQAIQNGVIRPAPASGSITRN